MSGLWSRVTAAAAAVATFGLVAAGSVVAGEPAPPQPSSAYAYDGDLVGFPPEPSGVVVDGSESTNEIGAVLYGSSGYLISDTAAGIVPSGSGAARVPCAAIDAETVLCDRLGPKAFVSLGGADDRLRAQLGADVSADGGPGVDRLRTGPGADRLRGGALTDRLEAGAGDDEVHGDAGRDAAYGNKGSDDLRMADGRADRVIACGPGKDTAVVDARIDPTPRGCEKVRIRPLEPR